jgi:hypothetical protein
MKKLVKIQGELDQKGTTANKLAVMAAKAGKNLTDYLYDLFEEHVREQK